ASDLARYQAVTPASVRQFASSQLGKNARVVIHCVPGKQDLGTPVPTPAPVASKPGEGAESTNPDAEWRNQQPKAGAARPFRRPVPQTFQLPNGLTVYYTQRPGLPIVSARLVVRSGSEENPIDRPGLAGFTAALLTEGTTTRSALQVADQAAQLGTSLSTASSMDSTSVSVSALTRNFPAALDLVADVTLHPTFPKEETERQRASRLASLADQRANPTIVATNVMNAALFGTKHPYGYSELGTRESIEKISPDEMTAFWKRYFVANNAALVVAGDISLDELKPLVQKTFGGWQRAVVPAPKQTLPVSTTAKLIVVDMGASAQSQVRTAAIGAARSTPDFPRMQVM